MKKSFVFAAILTAACHFSFAQTTNTFPLEGSVGIGTTSPGAKLHIIGTARFDGTYDGANNIQFTPAGGSGNTWELYPQPQGYGLYNRTNHTFPFFVTNGDNLGLGTLNPTEKLDVRGNIYWSGSNSGNPRALKIGYSGGNYGGIGYNIDFTGSTGLFNRPLNDQTSYLEFWTGGFRFFGTSHGASAQNITLDGSGSNLNLLATITNSGSFGIGTANPSNKLDVNGGVNATGYYLKNSGSLDYPGAYLHRLRAEDGNFYIDGDIGSSTYAPAVTVHRHGNIGIGTTEMRGYKLAVNGKIRAQEIKIEATPWPDYVFTKNYQLPTLQETETHIKEKGHLPGIPSAEEVKANGINLGEMNAKLLQKIEELTLHLIEMEKKNEKQQAQIDKLNSDRK